MPSKLSHTLKELLEIYLPIAIFITSSDYIFKGLLGNLKVILEHRWSELRSWNFAIAVYVKTVEDMGKVLLTKDYWIFQQASNKFSVIDLSITICVDELYQLGQFRPGNHLLLPV